MGLYIFPVVKCLLCPNIKETLITLSSGSLILIMDCLALELGLMASFSALESHRRSNADDSTAEK